MASSAALLLGLAESDHSGMRLEGMQGSLGQLQYTSHIFIYSKDSKYEVLS